MFGRRIAAAAAAWLAATISAAAGELEKLQFLTGYWVGEKENRTFEELWMPAGASTMIGVWRSTKDGALANTEHFLIWETEEDVFLRISLPAERYGVLSETSGVMRAAVIETNSVRFEKAPDAPGGLAAFGYALTDAGELRIDVTLVEDAAAGHSFSHYLHPQPLRADD